MLCGVLALITAACLSICCASSLLLSCRPAAVTACMPTCVPHPCLLACSPTLLAELHQRRAEATEAQLEEVLTAVERAAGGPSEFPARAALVTFNREAERNACLASLPHGGGGCAGG